MTKINERHDLLSRTIGTRPEEDYSYEQAQVLIPVVIFCFVLGSVLEIVSYIVFNYKVLILNIKLKILILKQCQVHPWKEMMVEEENINTKKKIDWQEICLKLLLPQLRVSNSYIRTISASVNF